MSCFLECWSEPSEPVRPQSPETQRCGSYEARPPYPQQSESVYTCTIQAHERDDRITWSVCVCEIVSVCVVPAGGVGDQWLAVD